MNTPCNCVEIWRDWDEEGIYDLSWELFPQEEVEGIPSHSWFYAGRRLPARVAARNVFTYSQKRHQPDPWDFFAIGESFTLVSERLKNTLMESCGSGWGDFYQFIPAVFANQPPFPYWVLNLLHKVDGTFRCSGKAGEWLPSHHEGGESYPYPNALQRSSDNDSLTVTGLPLARRLHEGKFRGLLMTAMNWMPPL